MLVSPLYMLQVYDRVLVSGSHATLLFLTIFALVALIVLATLEIVREITDPSRADPLQVIASFEQLASKDETSSNPGYHTAWKIMGSVLPRLMRQSSPIGAAQGAQSHLCKQYASIITSHVRSAELQGQDVRPNVDYGNNAASLIASYVKLVSGSHASVWEILYYCTY